MMFKTSQQVNPSVPHPGDLVLSSAYLVQRFSRWGFCFLLAMFVVLTVVISTPLYAADKKDEEFRVPADATYRYRDDDGRVVIATQVPARYVKNGYSVMNRSGQVIKVVEAALTEEELALIAGEIAANEKYKQKLANRKAGDDQLIRTFSTAEDAERALERKISALDVIVDITRGNISRLSSQLENLYSKAAGIERGGKEVGDPLLEEMGSITRQISDGETFIKQKQQEKIDVAKSFALSIKRLKELGR